MRAPRTNHAGADPPVETWGSWVQRHLDEHGWSATDLARTGGFDRSLVGRWTHDGKQASIERIRVVCRAFGCDIREGLVIAGVLTVAELWPPVSMVRLPTEVLVAEMARRMAERSSAALVSVAELRQQGEQMQLIAVQQENAGERVSEEVG